MPSTIEEQIASYYGWVEELSSVSLRPSGTLESSTGIDSHGDSELSALVLGSPESGPIGGRGRTIGLAAAVLIGVVALTGALIAVKGDDPQRLVPTDSPPPATTSPAATIPATTTPAAVIEPDGVPAEQMSKIRTMVDAINTRNSDAFMEAFAPEGEFDGRGSFADSTSIANRLQNVTQGPLIEAWMSFNDAWGLEAELKSCALQDVQPFWSDSIDGIVKCAVATRWHTLSMEITEDWYFELDGPALLYWDSIGCCGREVDLINLNPPERTLPLGYDGLEAWEIWLQTNDPDEAARLLGPRTGWPDTCEGCPEIDDIDDLLAPGDPERAARLYPLLLSVENAWIIDGHPFTPAGLIPYDPALAQEIESSIQSYLENNPDPGP